jgi:MFS transporter, PHS family, inorganic phosphate transporter
MMAAVFLMQSLGQLAAALVGLVVLIALGNQHGLVNLDPSDPASKRWVDSIWRTVIGAGAFPALVAIVFRLTIPESPRFTLDVDHDGQRALEDIREHYSGHIHGQSTQDLERRTEATREEAAREAVSAAGPGHTTELIDQQKSRPTATIRRNLNDNEEQEEEQEEEEEEDDDEEEEEEQEEEQEEEEEEDEEEDATDDDQKAFSKADLYEYFIAQGSWRFLAGTSTCWFLLDFAFYGLGINSPRQIAHVWLDQPTTNSTLADWQSADPIVNIYHILKLDAIQYIYTVSIGSVVGSLLLIKLIDYVPRKALLIVSFLLLAALFFVVGGTLFAVEYTNQHALTIVLYALCQLFFNLGPNALTFIVRIFLTCHHIFSWPLFLLHSILQHTIPHSKQKFSVFVAFFSKL